MTTQYYNNNKVAGEITTDQVPLAADTYFDGMPLKYNSTTHVYEYSEVGSELAGIIMLDPQVDSRVLSAAGFGTIIKGGKVFVDCLVDGDGDPLTIDEDFIAATALNGFYFERR